MADLGVTISEGRLYYQGQPLLNLYEILPGHYSANYEFDRSLKTLVIFVGPINPTSYIKFITQHNDVISMVMPPWEKSGFYHRLKASVASLIKKDGLTPFNA